MAERFMIVERPWLDTMIMWGVLDASAWEIALCGDDERRAHDLCSELRIIDVVDSVSRSETQERWEAVGHGWVHRVCGVDVPVPVENPMRSWPDRWLPVQAPSGPCILDTGLARIAPFGDVMTRDAALERLVSLSADIISLDWNSSSGVKLSYSNRMAKGPRIGRIGAMLRSSV